MHQVSAAVVYAALKTTSLLAVALTRGARLVDIRAVDGVSSGDGAGLRGASNGTAGGRSAGAVHTLGGGDGSGEGTWALLGTHLQAMGEGAMATSLSAT